MLCCRSSLLDYASQDKSSVQNISGTASAIHAETDPSGRAQYGFGGNGSGKCEGQGFV